MYGQDKESNEQIGETIMLGMVERPLKDDIQDKYRVYIILEHWLYDPDMDDSNLHEEEEVWLLEEFDDINDALDYANKANGILTHEGVDDEKQTENQ